MLKIYCIVALMFVLFLACSSKNTVLVKIHEGEYDELGVKSGYINFKGDTIISLDSYHYCYTDTFKKYAIVLKHGGGCVAIDQNENELFEVYWCDNGPDIISDGLFRIRKNGKVGFANDEGQIVIEPIYECATPFKNGLAKVTYDCSLKKEEEHTKMESDSWFYIDYTGNLIQE